MLLLGVGDLVVAAHAPLPGGSEHLDLRGEGRGTDVEAHLIVALACAAVGDRVGLLLLSDTHQVLHDQRTTQGGRERVDAFVEGTCLERWPDVFGDELVARIENVRANGADIECTLPRTFEVDLASHVHGQRRDLGVVFLLEPAHGNGRVQPPAVREDDLFGHRVRSFQVC